jgi:hypothetical protein
LLVLIRARFVVKVQNGFLNPETEKSGLILAVKFIELFFDILRLVP